MLKSKPASRLPCSRPDVGLLDKSLLTWTTCQFISSNLIASCKLTKHVRKNNIHIFMDIQIESYMQQLLEKMGKSPKNNAF